MHEHKRVLFEHKRKETLRKLTLSLQDAEILKPGEHLELTVAIKPNNDVWPDLIVFSAPAEEFFSITRFLNIGVRETTATRISQALGREIERRKRERADATYALCDFLMDYPSASWLTRIHGMSNTYVSCCLKVFYSAGIPYQRDWF